ncbi:coenzyme F420-dependent N5,N10-methylene tetrahydromethanopterin reductase and related flavin-dependent oxidoreductases [Moorella thermoacetica Y72]|uniref:Coenzyme F420-dependent N5,N10-methylene tetrahydromethanopterin reductase and related flavin-dependent oxidoreductases n=1 Tax=Moorella thermoacetica Y72 TaxID=1325331 RepID=A0A0S6UGT2_NEOTH|nr:coenzyme F420-dependent N5,N10-methylene tetrahydromethanopterin reductase and related flavin-dependent oxidoreductases [Moorella thermoacetica Y72]
MQGYPLILQGKSRKTLRDFPTRLLGMFFNIGHCCPDSRELFSILVGNLQVEFLFQGHDEFYDIQGIGIQVLKGGLHGYRVFLDPQLLSDDPLDFFKNVH